MSTRRTSSGHSTSSIPRARTTKPQPKNATTRKGSARPATKGRSAAAAPNRKQRGDLTLPIAREKQVASNRGARLVVWGGAITVTTALVAALFVLPVKAYLRQEDELAAKRRELALLESQNAELAADVAALETPAGIEQAAREELGYVRRGEVRLSVLPAPAAPLTLPTGWPYDAIAQVLTTRATVTTP